jgi:integrase
MSVHEKQSSAGRTSYVVRWREGDRNRSRSFTRRRDADRYDAEVERRRQLGPIALSMLDAGAETLDAFVADTYAPHYMEHLAASTKLSYTSLYAKHIAPTLGHLALRDITPGRIAAWQTERLSAEVGRDSVRKAHVVLGAILRRAMETGRIASNAARVIQKPRPSQKSEVRPLSPATVEAIRQASLNPQPAVVPASKPGQRRRRSYETPEKSSGARLQDATLISVLGYAGLRPGEALALRWGHVQERTIVVNARKTGQRRSIRILGPLAVDLAQWKLASVATDDADLLFPGESGEPWTSEAYKSWARRVFAKAAKAAGRPDATPYTLRHSFASLLLHEGRSVIYVARQLGHSATMTLEVYGHVIEELDDAPQLDAESAIQAARGAAVPSEFPQHTTTRRRLNARDPS